jgi:type II secretory pathway component PulF
MYSYRAVNSQGKNSKGLQDAANLIDLELHLKRSGLDLISARLIDRSNGNSSFGMKKIKKPDLITFFFNLEQLY